MGTLIEAYNVLFKDLSDPRVYDWPFMSGPWEMLGITFLYLYSIYVFLPSYMADRKPYSLKRVIQGYNIYQVVACSIVVYGVATSGWTTHYTLGCQLVDYSEDKMAVRMANFMWWHMLIKLSELIETVFFVLRKKHNQVSGLHVFHHLSTLFLAWSSGKYFPGGVITFGVLLNSSTHILMYTYYFLASLGPGMQKRLQVVKSKLTLLQMIQLCILFVHATQILFPSCHYMKAAAYAYLPSLAINISLFLKFYIQNYIKKKKKTASD